MADLPTNLKDDILDSSVNTRRKYRMIENGDGTYSFEDATEYNQVGDEYGAGLINETNKQVNARVEKAVVVRDLETIGAITQPGFIPDALALKDVNDSLQANELEEDWLTITLPFTAPKNGFMQVDCGGAIGKDNYVTLNVTTKTATQQVQVVTYGSFTSAFIPLKKGDVLSLVGHNNATNYPKFHWR